jgi:transposase
MQTQLPIFPSGTGLINSSLGVLLDPEKTVWYLHNGSPIHFHLPDDQDKFRYVTSHLIFMGLCTQTEIERFFHVSPSSIQRYLKIYMDQGAAGFVSGSGRKGGVRYKTTPELVEKIQKLLDRGDSQNSIARKFKISEGTIRYQIQQGVLKKKHSSC